MDGMNGEIY